MTVRFHCPMILNLAQLAAHTSQALNHACSLPVHGHIPGAVWVTGRTGASGRSGLAGPAASVPRAAPAMPMLLPWNCGRSCCRPLACGEATEATGFGQGGSAGVLGFSLTGSRLLSLGSSGGDRVCGTVDVTSNSFSIARACRGTCERADGLVLEMPSLVTLRLQLLRYLSLACIHAVGGQK